MCIRDSDWANQMWFRADTLLLANELEGLGDVYPFVNKQIIEGNNTISIQKATEMIGEIAEKEGIEIKEGRVEAVSYTHLYVSLTKKEQDLVVQTLADSKHEKATELIRYFLSLPLSDLPDATNQDSSMSDR